MITIKGFGINANLANNTKDVVNEFGELSAWSSTYSTDRTIHYDDAKNGIVLTVFSAKNDESQDATYTIPVELKTHILKVIKWTYDKCLNKGAEVYAHELLNDLIEAFQTEAETFKSGNIVKDINDNWMPQWLSWKQKGAPEANIKIWFSDDSFRRTYDEYEIVVVPPVKVLDDFFKVSNKVKTILSARDYSTRIDDIQTAKMEKPETFIRTEMFRYVDPLNKEDKTPTHWDILIYGEGGNNIDSVKDAIIDYILKNSKHTRDEWAEILPDIFKRTEFILQPNWGAYALPNRVTEAGIYSPFTVISQTFDELKKYTGTIPDGHIKEHMQSFTHPYKSISIVSTSSNENRDNLFKLSDVFNDYIAQSSTSQDFNRQREKTRDWAEKISKMLILAEEMTPFSDIPRGYIGKSSNLTRLIRDGKLFLVMNFENIHYLIVAKYNYLPAEQRG